MAVVRRLFGAESFAVGCSDGELEDAPSEKSRLEFVVEGGESGLL